MLLQCMNPTDDSLNSQLHGYTLCIIFYRSLETKIIQYLLLGAYNLSYKNYFTHFLKKPLILCNDLIVYCVNNSRYKRKKNISIWIYFQINMNGMTISQITMVIFSCSLILDSSSYFQRYKYGAMKLLSSHSSAMEHVLGSFQVQSLTSPI